MVIWVIGLSGTGKSTLCREVLRLAKRKISNIVHLDGDEVRALFDNDLGYSIEERRLNAKRISNLCKFLDAQGIHVVCSVLSLFQENRNWNRLNIRNYFEVCIDCSIESLIARDSKGIYAKCLKNEIQNVAGIDIPYNFPENSNLVINNSGSLEGLLSHAANISELILD